MADTGVAIVGEVYLDMNADRSRQPGEPGVEGAEIQVLDATGHLVTSTRSDREGYYAIGGLTPALYTVTVQPPRGYIVLDNGATAYRATEVQAPVLVSTPTRLGLFLPLVRSR